MKSADSRYHWMDRFVFVMAVPAIVAYLGLYVMVPDVYTIGPAFLLLLALLASGRLWPGDHLQREDYVFMSALLVYFLAQCLVNLIHGEDISEFDLATRFLAGALVLVFTRRYIVSFGVFFFAVALGSVATGLLALYQMVQGTGGRVTSFDNPIHYGNGALALALVCSAGLVWSVQARNRVLWSLLLLAGFVLGLYASLMSGTRSGWVAAPVIVAVFAYTFFPSFQRHKVAVLIAAALLLLVTVIIVQVESVTQRTAVAVEEFQDYFAEGRNYTSVGLRLDMWKSGLTAFSDNPLVGVGPSGYDVVEQKLIEQGQVHPGIAPFRHLHNQYIDAMAKGGIVGLAAYLYLLLAPFILFMRRVHSSDQVTRALALGGALFISTHAVVNLTQSMLERNIGVMMFIFIPLIIWSVMAKRDDEVRSRQSK